MHVGLSPTSIRYIVITGISGFLMVALGAFGGHALQDRLDAEMLKIWDVAVRYHMIHTVALFLVALLLNMKQNSPLRFAADGFISGIALFSGSLYIYALTDISWLTMITPLGGLKFLAAWILLIVGVAKKDIS